MPGWGGLVTPNFIGTPNLELLDGSESFSFAPFTFAEAKAGRLARFRDGEFGFQDSRGTYHFCWLGMLTDGVSSPPWLASVAGQSLSGEWRLPGFIHDGDFQKGVPLAEANDTMYEGMICAGCSELKAIAVYEILTELGISAWTNDQLRLAKFAASTDTIKEK